MKKKFVTFLSFIAAASMAQASDIFWSGGTASYTNAADWVGGVVPGPGDNPINANGLNNVVQINAGNPDWTVSDLQAGGLTDASGAFEQNGQTVTDTGWFHVGNATNAIGVYTLNAGTLNVNGGRIFLGEAPNTTATLNINGGTINKSGDVFVITDGGWNGNGARTGTVNQVNGTVNSTSEIWIGQIPLGTGIYNLHGGSINSSNWFVIGRAGGNGTMNMDGGTVTQVSGGQPAFIISDGSVGTLNFSGGTINCADAEFWMGNNGGSLATNNMSGTAVLNANNWIAVGRGGTGVLNISGGAITKTGGGNITLSGTGIINQTGGAITNTTSQCWIPEGGTGTWNLDGGVAILGTVHVCQVGGSVGVVNIDSGLMRVAELSSGTIGGFSTVNFNGGTLQAAGDNANFLHDLTAAKVQAGGAVIDSQGFNIGVPQTLADNGGGLTKNGSGTLTLTGANTYSGNTVVNAGTLITGSGSFAAGSVTVADGAGFGVTVQAMNGEYTIANGTLGTSTGGSLNFDLSNFGNPALSSAPLNVSGTLTVNGTVTVNVADALPQGGDVPLVHYGVLAGSGHFVLGSIPVGVSANLFTNVANSSIDLNISGVNQPRWDGEAGGNWDIGLTTNWVNIGTDLPTFYTDGSPVLFNDAAAGTTNVNLTTTVSPSSLLVTNNNLGYIFAGSGKISGSAGLIKQGSNTLAILNTGGNSYTGPTVITGGSLIVTNLANGGSPSAIGASSANPTNLLIANATFVYAGAPVTTDRGYRMTGNSVIDAEGNFKLGGLAQATAGTLAKIGPATMAYAGVGTNILSPANVGGAYQVQNGTVVLDGSAGAQTNAVIGEMWVSSTPSNAANLVVTNTSLGISSWFALGRGNGNSNFLATASIYNSTLNISYANTGGPGNGGGVSLGYNNGLPNAASQVLTLAGTTTLINLGGNFNIAESAGSSAVLNVNDGASIISPTSRDYIGNSSSRAVWNLNSTATSTISTNGGQIFLGGIGGATDSGVGAINQTAGTLKYGNGTGVYLFLGDNGGTVATSYGSYNLSGGTINETPGDGFRIGFGGLGSYVQSGGTLNCGRYFAIGGNTTAANGVATFTGGTATINPQYSIHIPDSGSTGALNLGTEAGGTATIISLSVNNGTGLVLENTAGGNGVLNLNSGTLQLANPIYRANSSGGSAVVNINGAKLQAGAANTVLINNTLSSVNVYKGGLTVDSQGNTAAISANLLAATGNGIYPAGGTLTVPSNGGSGYIGAPLVNVTGGSGAGATAIATVTGGVVANVVLTSPGQNYVAGDVVNFAFVGGGPLTAATTFSYTLQAGDLSANAGGSLTKIGNGTLNLSGANTYTGTTTVSAGALGGAGSVSSPVTVASGATLIADVGTIGTFNINNSLTLAAGSTTSFKLTPSSNDQIAGLTTVSYNGALVVTNTSGTALTPGHIYQLFNSAVAGTGNFTSVTILPSGSGTFNPATGQLTIGATSNVTLKGPFISNGNFILTGTGAAGTAYTVLSTTNVALPLALWTTNTTGSFDSNGNASNAIPVSAVNRFFLLRQP